MITDIASAVLWTQHEAQYYGGDIENIFLCGHSAGAHLLTMYLLHRDILRSYGGEDIQTE
jgi:acetyl esterase/lipase